MTSYFCSARQKAVPVTLFTVDHNAGVGGVVVNRPHYRSARQAKYREIRCAVTIKRWPSPARRRAPIPKETSEKTTDQKCHLAACMAVPIAAARESHWTCIEENAGDHDALAHPDTPHRYLPFVEPELESKAEHHGVRCVISM